VKKRANKVRGMAAEPVERRASAARNPGIHAKAGTQRLAELDVGLALRENKDTLFLPKTGTV